ncbi:MAG: SDR family NAD(P)-dependent oxidoreductase [Mycobacterium sp.]
MSLGTRVDGALFDLTGHAAIVTGGGSGIGLGFAQGLSRAGASVALWGRNPDKLHTAAELLRVHGNPVVTMSCDVADENAVRDAMDRTVGEFGRLDSCFANAANEGSLVPFLDTSLDQFRSVTAVNLDGAFLTLREAARHMVRFGNGGSLVVTSSIGSKFGMPRNQAYGAAKAGVIAMVSGIAVEMSRYGIRANSVLPGWVETPMTKSGFADARLADNVLPRIPQRRWGTPGDFSAIAVYLASPASSYHTADTILIDGGYSVF